MGYMDPDGHTLKAERNGRVLAYIAGDGTIKSDNYGREIGFVESTGVVRDRKNGQQIGQVAALHIFFKAALLLLR